MGTISLTDAVPDTEIQSSLINNNNTVLEAEINGGLENVNVAVGADIDVDKLAVGSNGALLKTAGGVTVWSSVGSNGALLYNTGTDLAWTAAPTDGQVLRSVATTPTWTTSARVALRRAASQNVTNATWTALSFDTEDLDTDTMWVVGTPTHLEINTAGDYLVGGGVSFTAGAVGRIGVRVTKNGANTNLRHMFSLDDSSNKVTIAGVLAGLTASDYLEVEAYQSSSTTRATDTAVEQQAYGFASRSL